MVGRGVRGGAGGGCREVQWGGGAVPETGARRPAPQVPGTCGAGTLSIEPSDLKATCLPLLYEPHLRNLDVNWPARSDQ